MRVFAIVLCGGTSKRFENEQHKCLFELKGKPVIVRAMEPLWENKFVEKIVLVLHPSIQEKVLKAIHQFGGWKASAVVENGAERQYSVKNGLEALKAFNPKASDIVLVHNGCNPLVTPQNVADCIAAAERHGASVAAYKVKDTIKRVNAENKIIETLGKSELMGMQTPQCIQYKLFAEAHEKAEKDHFLGTDDVQLVERLGVQPIAVDCGYDNIKITTIEDIAIAEKTLEKRGTR